MAREVTRNAPQGTGVQSFSPSVGVATPGLNLQAQPTQFDQLREILLGPGMSAVNAAAEQGRQNQRMEALRERARAKSDARVSEVAREFDIQHRQAAAAQAQRKYSQQQQRLQAVKNEQMNLLTDDRSDNPEWLHRQVVHQFNNAATQEEREAWFGLLKQTEAQVKQSQLSEEKKRAAEILQSISLAGNTAHKAVIQMVDELQANPSLQEDLMGDGTNIHSRTLEWVLAEAAQAAPDLFNIRRSDPDYDLKVEARDQIIEQLEKRAMAVGRQLIAQHTQRVDASNTQILEVNLESLVWQYVQDPGFSLEEDGESFQAAFDESVRNFGAHLHPAQVAKLRDSAIIQAAQDIAQLRGDLPLNVAASKLDELENAAPHLRRVIQDARNNFQNSARMRLDTNIENRMRAAGIEMPTNDAEMSAVVSILHDEMDKLLMEGGVDAEGDLTDSEVQLVRALRSHVGEAQRALSQGVQRLTAKQESAIKAANDDRNGDAKDLWDLGPVRSTTIDLVPETRQERERLHFAQASQFNALQNHTLPDAAVDYYLEGFVGNNPEAVHDTMAFALRADAKVWTTLRDGFSQKGGPLVGAELWKIRQEIANSGKDLKDVDWETYQHRIQAAVNNTQYNSKEALRALALGEDQLILQEEFRDYSGRKGTRDLTVKANAVRRVYDVVADLAASQEMSIGPKQGWRLFGWFRGDPRDAIPSDQREAFLRNTLTAIGGEDVDAITNLFLSFKAQQMTDEEAAISTASFLQDNGYTFADTGQGPRLIYDRGALGPRRTDAAKLQEDANTFLNQRLSADVRNDLIEAFPHLREQLIGPNAQTLKDVIKTIDPDSFGSPGVVGDEFNLEASFAFNHPAWRQYQNNVGPDGRLAPRALLLVRDKNNQLRLVTTPDGRPITLFHHSMIKRDSGMPTRSVPPGLMLTTKLPNI